MKTTHTRCRVRDRRAVRRQVRSRAEQAERRDDDRRPGRHRSRSGRRSHHRWNRSRAAIRIRISSRRSRASFSSCRKPIVLVAGRKELEIGWLPPLITQSRNSKIQQRRRRATSTRRCMRRSSRFRRDKSRGRWATCIRWATRTTGSTRKTASALRTDHRREVLAGYAPTIARYFEQRLADFTSRLDAAMKRWRSHDGALQGHQGRHLSPVASRTLRNGSAWTSSATCEPRPGIPPSPQHTLDLINEMKRQNVKLVLVEP